ncbi:MAG TPA: LysM domain-containing protein [Opitutaceae bacterium]
MDTISREGNTNSIVPILGVIVGVLGLVLAGVALAKVSSVNKALAAQTEQLTKIDSMETDVRNAVATAEKANNYSTNLAKQTQDGFNAVSLELGNIRGEVAKLGESAKAPAKAAATAKSGEPAVAGPNEYVVKSGDTGMKIARSAGVSLPDLQSVNPGVNWNSLHVGQKLKLPKK